MSETDEHAHLFETECEGCGNTYDARDERAEDHAEDCPVREAYREMGKWGAG